MLYKPVNHWNLVSDAIYLIIHFNSNDIKNLVGTYNETLYIDFKNPKIKQLFEQYYNQSIRSQMTYGSLIDIIKSCKPKDNWRYNLKDELQKSLYENKSSFTMNYGSCVPEYANALFDQTFVKIKKLKNLKTFVLDGYSYNDFISIASKKVNIVVIDKLSNIINDTNDSMYNDNVQIPDFVYTDVHQHLYNIGLIL